MSKKELVVLWVTGIYTAFIICWVSNSYSTSLQEEIFIYSIPAWILGGLLFITLRDIRKKQEREKRNNL